MITPEYTHQARQELIKYRGAGEGDITKASGHLWWSPGVDQEPFGSWTLGKLPPVFWAANPRNTHHQLLGHWKLTKLRRETCSATGNKTESPIRTFLGDGRSWRGSWPWGSARLRSQMAWCGPSQVRAVVLARESSGCRLYCADPDAA